MIWNIMFSNEWPGSLKCMDTGISLLTRVSRMCSAILNLNSFLVSPILFGTVRACDEIDQVSGGSVAT